MLWPLIVLALILTCLIVPATVAEPFAAGDTAHRLHMARYPVVRLDNRIWLPVLQIHIWALYLVKAPLYAFKLIPCFYYFISIVLAGTLAFRLTGRNVFGLVFSLVFAFCFARQEMVMTLGTRLMQETIGLALFLLLLQLGALELKKSAWLLLIAALALLTRDSFWIYLAALGLLNWRKIIADRTYVWTFGFLYSVPVVWLLLIPVGYLAVDGRLPVFPTEWPLGINKTGNQMVSSFATSFSSLWFSLTRTKALYLVVALLASWLALRALDRLDGGKPALPAQLEKSFKPFSLLSLSIIYGLIILLDPFQATFGDRRMSLPLFTNAFVWALVLSGEAATRTRAAKYLVTGAILIAMIPSMKLDELLLPADPSPVTAVHQEIEADLRQLTDVGKARICILDKDYFGGLHRFLPATFYMNRIMLLQTKGVPVRACDVLFAPTGVSYGPGQGFEALRNYEISGHTYTLFRRE